MSMLSKFRQARQEILTQIALIEEMRRGSVIRQFLKVKLKGEREPILSGPYALFTCKQKGKTVSRRLHAIEEVRRLEQQVENYHMFQQLCHRMVEIGEAICKEKEREKRR
jgi:type II secretory pathway component PulF